MNHTRRVSILLALLALFWSSAAAAECDQNQAFNKMMAFNQAWMVYQQKYTALPPEQQNAQFQKFSSGSQRMAALSAKLATKDWNGACAGYDALAKEYGIDLTKAAQGMNTIEQLQKDGGRKGGSCDIADASKRLMGMTEKFQDKKANGETTPAEEKQFFADVDVLGPEMNKNPSAVCAKVDDLSKKYGLEK